MFLESAHMFMVSNDMQVLCKKSANSSDCQQRNQIKEFKRNACASQ